MTALVLLLAAQGITTAAIQGRVLQADGSPVLGASVAVTNLSDGRRWQVITGSTGTYVLEEVGVGGPYRIEARAVGFRAEARTGIALTLGERFVADFQLSPVAIELEPQEVVASADRLLNGGRTGPADIITRERIAQVPNHGRDFLGLTLLSPLVAISPSSGTALTGGISIAGQNRLYNSFQIDGGVNHDLYRGRLPGRETLPRPISLEAVEQIQILGAPFDTRYGTFAGGLVNTVTRSGSNELQGSVFAFLSDAALVGQNVRGNPVAGFTTWQYGATLGGPIVRNRAHYFISADLRHEPLPDPGPLISDTAGDAATSIGISYADALRFQSILRDSFQLDPGTLGPVEGLTEATDLFGKVTVQLGVNSHLEVSHHYAQGDRSGALTRTSNFYFLSSFDQHNPSTINTTRLIWTSLLEQRWSNELIGSWLRLHDTCRPVGNFPQVRANVGIPQLVAGVGPDCPMEPLNASIQDVYELTDNLTGAFGAHVVTLGAHAEALRFQDDWIQNTSGTWIFANLDSLARRSVNRYQRSFHGPGATPHLDVRAQQLGFYVQDRWSPKPNVSVLLGLRIDVPVFPDGVGTNTTLRDSLGIDTGHLPSGQLLWSPRLGLVYGSLRGGVGLFSGRVPYQWIGNAYRDNGVQDLFLDCSATRTWTFDPAARPIVCADGSGPRPRLSYFDPAMQFPQNLKVSLGADHRLPGGIVGTADVLFTQAVQQVYLTDANLVGPVGVVAAEANRPLYGTITGTANSFTPTPARRVASIDRVVRVSNSSGDESLSLSVQLRRLFGRWLEADAFYGYSMTQDRMSVINPFARSNLENTPLNGTLESRPLRASYFDVPHRVRLGATVQLPLRSLLTLMYAGASGTPYTHMATGDVNADGMGVVPLVNDVMYVPRDRADISIDGNGTLAGLGTIQQQDSVYAKLDTLIQAEPCLRAQRGRLLERNSCRNPWFGTVNARLSTVIPTRAGQSLELMADIYNVLNMLSTQWGQYRITIRDPWIQTVQPSGYDAAAGRPFYRCLCRTLRNLQDLESRWQMELGLRYVF
jgi:hypothetical protein